MIFFDGIAIKALFVTISFRKEMTKHHQKTMHLFISPTKISQTIPLFDSHVLMSQYAIPFKIWEKWLLNYYSLSKEEPMVSQPIYVFIGTW
jgi:hypothetical protein